MNKHKHADLIHAWADGAEIQFKGAEGWFYAQNPTWDGDTEYRIKPKELGWWENIPKHGILVKNNQTGSVFVAQIMIYPENCTPLTNEEIEAFKR